MPEGSRAGRRLALGIICWCSLLARAAPTMRHHAPLVDLRPCTDGYATTADGWKLGIRMYEPRRPDPGKLPVVLCHGLGLNGTFWTITKDHLARAAQRPGLSRLRRRRPRLGGEPPDRDARAGQPDPPPDPVQRDARVALDGRRPGQVRHPGDPRLRPEGDRRRSGELGRPQPGRDDHARLPRDDRPARAGRQLRRHGRGDDRGPVAVADGDAQREPGPPGPALVREHRAGSPGR